MTAREELELRGLVAQAWNLRDSGYLLDAVGALIEWHEQRGLRYLQTWQGRQAFLVRLLRETNPTIGREKAA